MVGTGVALGVTSVLTSKNEKINSGMIVGGVVVAVLAWIPKWMMEDKLERSVRVYNRD
jgi:hypothetical protein